MTDRPESFSAFWPIYLMSHRDPTCRALHFVGTTGAMLGLVAAVVSRDLFWALGGLVFAYALAWTGHFASEGNRPATFANPLWSLAGDLRMYFLWLSGRLSPAIRAAESNAGSDLHKKSSPDQ
jgi:hypothetical protein